MTRAAATTALVFASLAACVAGCRAPAGAGTPARGIRRSAQALTPDREGRIDRSTTGTTGIHGRWFATVDAAECQKRGKHAAEECSKFITPDPRSTSFGPTGDLGMCTVGVAAKVLASPAGRMDWGNIWGASIGLTLADGAGYDAAANGVTGFAFHIDSEPPPSGRLRVELSGHDLPPDAPTPFWNGASSESSPVHAGRNEVRWADVGGPIWIDQPLRFDPTHLVSIAFHVPTAPAGAVAFSFCISDVTALFD